MRAPVKITLSHIFKALLFSWVLFSSSPSPIRRSLASGSLFSASAKTALYSAASSGEPVYIKALTEAVEIKRGYMPTIAEGAVEAGLN